jgi:hypothetical protein
LTKKDGKMEKLYNNIAITFSYGTGLTLFKEG